MPPSLRHSVDSGRLRSIDFCHRLQGGETAFGGSEAVVVITLDPEGRRFRYILLATNRTGTMQREMNEAPPEYSFAGMTVFDTRFGGNEAAVILEAEITDD